MFGVRLLAVMLPGLILPGIVVGSEASDDLPSETSAAGSLRIMPMGDSITHAADPGYRGYLYRRLVDAGYDVDFIGSMHDMPTLPPDVALDPDHEGHGGFSVGPGPSRADDWTDGKGNLYVNLDSWLAPDNPDTKDVDIILLHIGVNDFANIQQLDPSYDLVRDFAGRLDGLLAKILSLRPNVAVIISSIIPGGNPKISAVFPVGPFDKVNPQLSAIAVARGTHVFFRDGAALEGTDLKWEPDDWNKGDVVHPNAQGQRKFAEFWFAAIEYVVKNDLLPKQPYADATPPRLQQTVPSGDAKAADYRKAIELIFSEPVRRGEKRILLTIGDQQRTLDEQEVKFDHRRVVIAPAKPLPPETDVVVHVEPEAVCDLQGNPARQVELAFRTRSHTDALYETNFDGGESDWRRVGDVSMSVRNGRLTCDGNGQCAYVHDKEEIKAPQLVYTAEISAAGAERCGPMFCVRDGSHAYALAMERGGTKVELHRIAGNLHQFNLNGNATKIADAELSTGAASSYRIRVQVDSQRRLMTAEINDTLVFQNYALDGPLDGSLGFISSWNGHGAWIDNVKISIPTL